MTKKMILIMLLISISFLLYPQADQEPFPVYFSESINVKIDGSNEDWPPSIPCVMESDTQVVLEKRSVPEEYGAKIWLMLDSKNIFIYGEFVDKTPLFNRHTENEIYQGDCLEVYLGIREELNKSGLKENDTQFGIGMHRDQSRKPETWIWTKGRKCKDHDLITVQTGDNTYTLEARIPISNFFENKTVKSGNTIWFDFGVDDGVQDGTRLTQMIWYGDENDWKTPKNWRRGILINDTEELKKPYILLPPKIATKTYTRVYFWNNGKPFVGAVKMNTKEFKTDNSGGITIQVEDSGQKKFSFNYGEGTFELSANVEDKKEKVWIILPVKDIKVNQLGYKTNENKEFILTDNKGILKSDDFSVISVVDKKVVYKGKLKKHHKDDIATGDILYSGDFSDLKKKGSFRIKVDGFSDSYVFRIADDIMSELFYISMRSYYLQRCGIEIEDDKISGLNHAKCHMDDGYLLEPFESKGELVKVDVTGGWHDAGDYGKYIPTAGLSCIQLLMMYEISPGKFNKFKLDIPESKDRIPDLLDEIKWELDWMLKMQEKSGGVYHKVNTLNFPPTIVPEEDTEPRYINPVTTPSTAIFAGSMAYAYRIYSNADPVYGNTIKKAAIDAGKYLLQTHTKNIIAPLHDNTGWYDSGSYTDELFWAFSELYRLTGDNKYYNAAKLYFDDNLNELPIIGWENTYTLGILALYYAENTPVETKKKIEKLIIDNADKISEKILNDGYRSSLTNAEYTWASNKNLCAKGMFLILANQVKNNDDYLDAARKQINYILGMNAISKSFLTSFGADYVRYPHHRLAEVLDMNIPGLLVGGPNNNAECGTYKRGQSAKGYRDYPKSYSCNEYAIDYNAPLVFLAGYFMDEKPGVMYKGGKSTGKGIPVIGFIISGIILVLLAAVLFIVLRKFKRKQ